MSKLAIDKSFYSLSFQAVSQICQPLVKHFHINYFDHYRVFKDGTCGILSNNGQWTDHFLKQSFAIPGVEEYPKPGVFLWAGIKALQTYDNQIYEAREFFNIDNGITFVEPHANYYDMFNFATTRENTNLINFYLNNQNILAKFILYFKTISSDLLKKAIANKQLLPVRRIIPPNKNAQETKIQFLSEIASKNYKLTRSHHSHSIANRELECVVLLQKGFTAKQIARHLNLSYRTVEHYIENIRFKLNCSNKQELLQKLSQEYFINLND